MNVARLFLLRLKMNFRSERVDFDGLANKFGCILNETQGKVANVNR